MFSPHLQLFLSHFSRQGSLPPIKNNISQNQKSGYYQRDYTLASLNQEIKNVCQLGNHVKTKTDVTFSSNLILMLICTIT